MTIVNEAIVIGIALKNGACTIRRAVQSIVSQINVKREVIILIVNDNSTDNWHEKIKDLIQQHNILIQTVNLGKAYKVRNFINGYVRNNLQNAEYIGRLDSDDYLQDDLVLSRVEEIINIEKPDVIICGNKLSINNKIIERINYADKRLLENQFLKEKLFKMREGIPEGELPSCNTFIRKNITVEYPSRDSAEDHWYTVSLLLNKCNYRIHISENLLYCVYSLTGNSTHENRRKKTYLKSREELYQYFINSIETHDVVRKEKAYQILRKYKNQDYVYLGQGFSGVVFHDKEFVYKVHVPAKTNFYNEVDKLLLLKEKKKLFTGAKHFYEIQDIFLFLGYYILIYTYEESEPVSSLSEDDYMSFLTECWERKIICKSLTKENFIRVKGTLKLIDYEIEPFNDNLFLNMAARAFLQVHYLNLPQEEFDKLKRTAINNFNIPELKKFPPFLKRLFSNISFKQSMHALNEYNCKADKIKPLDLEVSIINELKKSDEKEISVPFKSIRNIDSFAKQLIVNNLFLDSIKIQNIEIDSNSLFTPQCIEVKAHKIIPPEKPVSLIIKACGQDSECIYENVEHIIRQLCCPNSFHEKILLIDNREPDEYLRQYTQSGSLEKLYEKAQSLIESQLIDKVVELSPDKVTETNRKWFNLETEYTHTYDNIPVTPQLFGFEAAECDYILQMDSDVMIGRRNYDHSFLNDMIQVLENNENVISVAFGIPHSEDMNFQEYFGFSQGGFIPDVRMCMIEKSRLLKLRPLQNQIKENGLALSWYKSLKLKQDNSNYVSIRGGNTDSYFVHPQNYRKTNPDVWFTLLDRVEKQCLIECQKDKQELQGSFYDLAVPKRNESIVAIIIIENDTLYECFLRCFFSIISQKNAEFGLIIIDNDSGVGYNELLVNLAKQYYNVTFIRNRYPQKNTANIYKGVHYFMSNPESLVTLINPQDYLLGNYVFGNLINQIEIYKADVSIGKELNINEIYKDGLFDVDFINPRQEKSNVFANLICFRKNLFDSLSIYDLKEERKVSGNHSNFERLSQIYHWFDDKNYCSLIIPIVEMSENPIRYDYFNYIIDNRKTDKEAKYQRIEKLRKEKPKKRADILLGRKDFIPNQNKIEIDITYQCNLLCDGCNRSCTQAPSDENITINQIENFISETKKVNKKWEVINILGGEPTLHPDFILIITKLLNYIDKCSPDTILQITSNGLPVSKQKLKELPDHRNLVIDRLSFKTNNTIDYFSPFNEAPIDNIDYKNEIFSKGCWVTSYCGIGLNPFGFYCCSVAAGIDRVLGLNKGIKSIKMLEESEFKNQLNKFCRFCGNYSDYEINKGDFIPRCEKAPFNGNGVSKTWRKIYNEYKKSKPILTRIYE